MENSDISGEETLQHFAGMGATCYPEGVHYRVWAPHADSVSVVGNFNEWKDDANPLQPEDNGFWSVLVENSKEGDEY